MENHTSTPRKRGRRLFTPEMEQKIFKESQGELIERLAVKYHCSVSTIYNIIRRASGNARKESGNE